MTPFLPRYKDICHAHTVIAPFIHRTPLFSNKSIDKLLKATLYFKGENLQKSGAFKIRGATYAVESLPDAVARHGVATHSSGNHGAALAMAARNRKIPAHVVMPENAPTVKKRAVAEYGAQITFCEPNLEARQQTISRLIADTGAVEIHPYDDFHVIAGQGTAAKELLEDEPGLDIILVPVGGGGLLAGSALSVKELSATAEIIGCEPAGADDAYRSFHTGEIIPSRLPDTIADGLLTSLGERNFAIIKEKVDAIATVSDEAIIDAMRMVWERMKLVIEPSAAVTLAVLLDKKLPCAGKKVGIILSGGNLDLDRLPFHEHTQPQ